jgi:hypothetical protein
MSKRSLGALAFAMLAYAPAFAQTPGAAESFTATPLKGLNGIPTLQFSSATTTPCYGLSVSQGSELTLKKSELDSLGAAGFKVVMPTPDKSGRFSIGQFIKVSDSMFKMSDTTCLDILKVEVQQQAAVTLNHSGERFAAPLPIWGTETVVIGQNKQQFLGSRSATLTKMFEAFAGEWKKQNGR